MSSYIPLFCVNMVIYTCTNPDSGLVNLCDDLSKCLLSQQHAVFEVVPRSDVVKAGELAPVFRIKLIYAEGWSIGKTA